MSDLACPVCHVVYVFERIPLYGLVQERCNCGTKRLTPAPLPKHVEGFTSTCATCGIVFPKNRFVTRPNVRTFCSIPCRQEYAAIIRRVDHPDTLKERRVCAWCAEEFEVAAKSKRQGCSPSCTMKLVMRLGHQRRGKHDFRNMGEPVYV